MRFEICIGAEKRERERNKAAAPRGPEGWGAESIFIIHEERGELEYFPERD